MWGSEVVAELGDERCGGLVLRSGYGLGPDQEEVIGEAQGRAHAVGHDAGGSTSVA
jgi:hypothetical protein